MYLKGSIQNISNGQLPVFQEEPAFSKICPNLTFQQVNFNYFLSIYYAVYPLYYWIAHSRILWVCRHGMALFFHGRFYNYHNFLWLMLMPIIPSLNCIGHNDIDWRTFHKEYNNICSFVHNRKYHRSDRNWISSWPKVTVSKDVPSDQKILYYLLFSHVNYSVFSSCSSKCFSPFSP